ncbi:MAG: PEP-CTERM sorting domain-containing protein [Planctomycetia bacterium]|nr:PEP-CTERM sorting domain-containing protein [Planctomycetia bacterium]
MEIRLGMFLAGVLTTFSTVWGGYVWNGGDSGVYSGTTNWVEDVTRTGKWITSGTVTLTDDNQVIIGNNTTDTQLTVDNATVTTASRLRVGFANAAGTLILVDGASFTAPRFSMGNNDQTGTIEISGGSTLTLTGETDPNASYIGDSNLGNALIKIDGGTLSTSSPMYFGHKGDATMTVSGNGSLKATKDFFLGSGGYDSVASKTGTITIGTATSSGTASFAILNIGRVANGILDIQNGTVTAKLIENSGKISVQSGTLTTTENLQLTQQLTQTYFSNRTAELYVGEKGVVTADSLITGIATDSTSIITVEKGGRINVLQTAISRETGNTTLKIDGEGSSVSVTNFMGLGNRSTGTTNVEVTNGGLLQAGYLEGAKSAGAANITVSGEGSLLKTTGNTSSSLNGGSLTVTDQAQAIFDGRLYFGRNFGGDTPGQTGTTIQVEVSEGGLLQADGFWFGQRENTINVTISSGGKLYDTGSSHGQMYVGDAAGSTAVIDIVGGILQADKNINIAQDGNGTIRVSQGGSLTAAVIDVGRGTGKGLLQIVGKDVSVKTTENFTTYSGGRGTLHFLADSTGLGCLEVGKTYSQSGTVTLGVAGGLACWTPEVAAAKYTLLNANGGNDSFKISNTSIWETAENDRTVQLNDDLRFSETLSLNSGMLSIGTAYGTMGYLNFTGESGYFNVQLSFDGLNDLDATADLALWMASENGMENASVLDVGVIQLSSLFSADGSGILAWDWSLYNTANSMNVSLTGLAGQNVPEPATWGMLLLGIVFLMYQRRKNTK